MSDQADDDAPSYIDYEAFLSPTFSPAQFANTLVLTTNNPTDTPLDLSTPLSRVLFDIQEIDSHIDGLTTRSALPILSHTQSQAAASGRILTEIDAQVGALNESYRQLEKEVIKKHAEADEVRQVATRLWETLRVGRSLGRCLTLGRQLELQHAEVQPNTKKEDHRALVRCAETILQLRSILEPNPISPTPDLPVLDRINTIRTLRTGTIQPLERAVRDHADRIIREFSLSGSLTFAQSEDARRRTVSALETLYLVSPTALSKSEKWTPSAMLQALEVYLRTALQSSIASLARSLAALPTLDRTLGEVQARCRNIVALEAVLESTRAPVHLLRVGLDGEKGSSGNLLQPLLAYLETGSLASYFWRTLAGSLATRVAEIMNRGGVAARTLRTNKGNVGDAIRECVVKGSVLPGGLVTKGKKGDEKGWEREVAVMVGSVVGNLGR